MALLVADAPALVRTAPAARLQPEVGIDTGIRKNHH